jgi:CRISPR-associated endonuclease/helicase Cas3
MAQDAQDFASWYQHRHGYQPFPWQAALASRIAAEDWPDALTPPTGSGKTAVIDVWLWARLQGLPVPRRLVYVIDRRLVVDGVTEYATTLAASLEADQQPAVVTLRGGMAFDDGWLSDPLRPAVIISTVDQVGSRLLFSGYGISSKAASIHAGLLGNDALFVIDEVHLVRPLLQTLASVAGATGKCPAAPVARPADVRHLGGRQHPWPQQCRLAASRTVAPAQGGQADAAASSCRRTPTFRVRSPTRH